MRGSESNLCTPGVLSETTTRLMPASSRPAHARSPSPARVKFHSQDEAVPSPNY
jgi:hypothetical protein